MSVPTVLVAEDDPLALKLFVTLVERNGYRALAAADGREALHIFRYERPHRNCARGHRVLARWGMAFSSFLLLWKN